MVRTRSVSIYPVTPAGVFRLAKLDNFQKIIFLVIIFLGLFGWAGSSKAANHYVRQSAIGGANGNDWTNAYTSLPNTLTRGDTYYIADGSYGAYTFDDATSGSAYIYIKKSTFADYGTSTGWSDTYGDGQATFTGFTLTTGYYEVDGAMGGGPGSWETGFGFKVTNSSHAMYVNGAVSHLILKHIDFVGGGANAPRSGSGGTDSDLLYVVYGSIDNLTISYCALRDSNRTMILSWPSPMSNVLIEYTKFARNGSDEHAEAWSSGTDDNVTIRYSIFEDMNATGFICAVNGQGDASNWQIYGNVFRHTTSSMFINTGVIFTRYDSGGSPIGVRAVNWQVHNNVFAGLYGWAGQITYENSTGSTAYNNVWINNHADVIGVQSGTTDYTWYYNNYGYTTSSSNRSTVYATDAHDVIGTADPFTNSMSGNFIPIMPIPGLSLLAPYNKDSSGNTRGVDGVWDRGAYEYSSGGGADTTPPARPSGLTVQ